MILKRNLEFHFDMMTEEYLKKCQRVLEAQMRRVSSEIEHVQNCQCEFCRNEREARECLAEMPEHLREQKNWVFIMHEILKRI